jgi:hypothetical protein
MASGKWPWIANGFTACGKTRHSYQGIVSALPQLAQFKRAFRRGVNFFPQLFPATLTANSLGDISGQFTAAHNDPSPRWPA